jgi:hypothetical protein
VDRQEARLGGRRRGTRSAGVTARSNRATTPGVARAPRSAPGWHGGDDQARRQRADDGPAELRDRAGDAVAVGGGRGRRQHDQRRRLIGAPDLIEVERRRRRFASVVVETGASSAQPTSSALAIASAEIFEMIDMTRRPLARESRGREDHRREKSCGYRGSQGGAGASRSVARRDRDHVAASLRGFTARAKNTITSITSDSSTANA